MTAVCSAIATPCTLMLSCRVLILARASTHYASLVYCTLLSSESFFFNYGKHDSHSAWKLTFRGTPFRFGFSEVEASPSKGWDTGKERGRNDVNTWLWPYLGRIKKWMEVWMDEWIHIYIGLLCTYMHIHCGKKRKSHDQSQPRGNSLLSAPRTDGEK